LTSIKDNAQPFGLSAEECIARIAKPYNIPLAFSFPAGHALPNMPLLIGSMVRLEVTAANSTLMFKK
jgi:muramoyltetrapeptide carboxypeptidase